MSSLTKGHLLCCLNNALDKLNRRGDRSPWPEESLDVFSPEEKWRVDLDWNQVDSTLPDKSVDWFIVLNANIYGLEGGMCVAISERLILDANFDPYEHIITTWLDRNIRIELSNLKDLADTLKEEDDEDY